MARRLRTMTRSSGAARRAPYIIALPEAARTTRSAFVRRLWPCLRSAPEAFQEVADDASPCLTVCSHHRPTHAARRRAVAGVRAQRDRHLRTLTRLCRDRCTVRRRIERVLEPGCAAQGTRLLRAGRRCRDRAQGRLHTRQHLRAL